MKINEYMQLLYDGKLREAEQVRMSTIPDKLIKFIWLDENAKDEKKFKSLAADQIWFSHKRFLNDPYEFKGMLIDRQKLSDAGYPDEVIEAYQSLFDFDDYGITCLSSNQIDYLPMWAYYTNNHRGFCIEYDVIKKDCIHEVLYEPERIKIASLIFQCKDAVKEAILTGHRDEADKITKVLLQNLFTKTKSWQHEKEYRIVYPIEDGIGKNVLVSNLGMRTNRIIAGINCSDDNIARLNKISGELGLGDCYKSRIHSDQYTLEIFR